ncbi:hypothetical protein STCU_00787 [Strigomonas culicis]|uniref:Lysosomal dipeptide transporter MFSD1 n=1 Tax=Strigomonas culicis TaxID=28005 RepID=S9WJC5_9TRYP|nr:hypothetical protein STCU_00787 [Strigomonas culicis]|eukprot:EPY36035.1 hypothetical protein STCU_00787 [Strigomonas culicis]
MTNIHDEEDVSLLPVEQPLASWWQMLKEEIREFKWLVLVGACFLTFGNSFITDFPGSFGTGEQHTIESLFKAHNKPYTQSMNQALYSVYSWPNTILSIFGGLLIDRYLHLRRAMLLFTLLVVGGAGLFYLGVRTVRYPLLVAGRVVFGLGGESLNVAQSAFVARWFRRGRGMALAYGITISFSRVGSSFNFIFSPMLAASRGVAVAALAGVAACGLSLLACCLLIAADVHAVRTGYIEPEGNDADGEERTEEAGGEGYLSALGLTTLLTCKPFLLLTVICVACYMSIYPFIGIAKNYFEVKYHYEPDYSGKVISGFQITSAIASPIVGLLVDSIGGNVYWLIAASLAFGISHVLFIFTMTPALVMMVGMGVCYSFLVSGLWPSVPLSVPENVVGLSFGAMTAVQNIGFSFFPLLIGKTLDRYTPHFKPTTTTAAPSGSSSSSGGGSGSGSGSGSSRGGSSGSGSGSASSGSWNSSSSGVSILSDIFSSCSTGSGSGSSSSDAPFTPSSLPRLEGFVKTEVMFMIAAAVSLVASLVLLLVDVQQGGILSASSKRRHAMLFGEADAEEEEGLLRGDIPESQRTSLL